MENQNITNDEVVELTKLLTKLKPGYYPYPIFREFTRLNASSIIEVVPLRRSKDGSVEILLLNRAQDDPLWPGQLHTPGTVVRAADVAESYTDAFKRIFEVELKGVETSEPVPVTNIFHNSSRGMESAQIFWVVVSGEPPLGQFFNVDKLPSNLVQSQMDFIPEAVEHFEKTTILQT